MESPPPRPSYRSYSKYSTTVAFIILAVATAVGFARVEQIAADVELDSVERAQELCEKDNDVRSLLGTTLRSLFESSDQTFSEELATIEERLTALEETVLAPTDCVQVSDDRLEKQS